ncbi:UNVERIFIED_ORG: portal protein [Clostridium botulinum]
MNLEQYIKIVYNNNPLWFKEEVKKPHHDNRIEKMYDLKNYLHGKHKVLQRKDLKYKEQELKVRKIILNNAKAICNFHSTYLVGKPVSLTGSKELVSNMQNIYNYGGFNSADFNIADKLVKYGDAFEYIYVDGDNITSKIIDSCYSYPVYSDSGEYIAFIEYWTNLDNVSYWNVYTQDSVSEWTNEGGKEHRIQEYINESGLPIHYKTMNDWDYRYGEGLLVNIRPLLDEIEDLMSKMGDSIYILSLNPILLTLGQQIEGSINTDAVGYNVKMEVGCDMKYVNSEMDYQSIKCYLDTIQNQLNYNAYIPNILGGNGNIANVSEVSLKIMYQLADVYAMLNEKPMREGLNKRFNIIRKLLGLESKDEYVNVTFNYSRPQNASELLDNLKKQFDMGAISTESIIEQSPLTSDKGMELDRIKREQGKVNNKEDNNTNIED